jgi:hypothetical protein
MTPLQVRRRQRDITIAMASLLGASTRFLGDVFDLDPARVCRVMRRLRVEFESKGGLNKATLAEAIAKTRPVKDRVGSTQVGNRMRIGA